MSLFFFLTDPLLRPQPFCPNAAPADYQPIVGCDEWWPINIKFPTPTHMHDVGIRPGSHAPESGHRFSNSAIRAGNATNLAAFEVGQSFGFDPSFGSPVYGQALDWAAVMAQAPFPDFCPTNNILWTGYNNNAILQPPDSSQHPVTELNTDPITLHDTDTNSAAAACLCGKSFSRRDALKRHIETASRRSTQAFSSLDASELYPCNLCDKYQGINSFKRRDHLRQHLGVKGYHKMNKVAIDKYLDEYH